MSLHEWFALIILIAVILSYVLTKVQTLREEDKPIDYDFDRYKRMTSKWKDEWRL